jgi:hypothetical protein
MLGRGSKGRDNGEERGVAVKGTPVDERGKEEGARSGNFHLRNGRAFNVPFRFKSEEGVCSSTAYDGVGDGRVKAIYVAMDA